MQKAWIRGEEWLISFEPKYRIIVNFIYSVVDSGLDRGNNRLYNISVNVVGTLVLFGGNYELQIGR